MTDTHGQSPLSADLFDTALREFRRAHLDAARALLDAAVEADPMHRDAWLLLAETHRNCDREVAAFACLRRANDLDPTDTDTLHQMALLCLDRGRFGEAAEHARSAVACAPSDPALTYLFGVALARAHRRDEAIAVFSEVLARNPDHAAVSFEIAMIELGRGNFLTGWPFFEKRHPLDASYRPPVGPVPWNGEPAPGRRLLVTAEGGYGDTIWAARFLPAVKALGFEVVFRVPPALETLFAALDGVDTLLVDPDNEPVDADLWCPILSLPARLGITDPGDFPPAKLHRRPSPEGRLDRLLQRGAGKKRVGIIWSGSVTYGNNRHRAASLADFLPLTEIPSLQLYSLQKGPPQADLTESGIGNLIIDADDFDFAETAALVEKLDLVIMTDSAVAHIAGSLNKPVWVLLDANPYWYHGTKADRSQWYPSIRYFRQSSPGDWAGVMHRILAALQTSDRSFGDQA